MPIATDRDYQRAISALSGGKLSPAVRSRLEENVRAYESGLTTVGRADAESGLMDATAGAVEASRPPETLPEARVGNPSGGGFRSMGEMEDASRVVESVAPSQAPQGSARPGSYTPQRAPAPPSVLDIALDKLGVVDTSHTSRVRLGDAVSNMIGGDNRTYMEPTRAEFAENAAKRGIDPSKLTDDDYREYADALWAAEYDKAQREGRAVTRGSSLEGGEAFTQGALENLVSGSSGALDAMTFGAGSDLLSSLGGEEAVDVTRALPEQHRAANIAGTVAGAFSPAGLPAKLSGRVSKVLAGGEASLARKMGAGAAAGGLSGLLSAEGGNVARDITDDMLDREPTGPRADPLTGALVGGLFGAGGNALSAGLSSLRSGLRSGPMGPSIRRFEEAGGKLGFWKPSVPDEIAATMDESAAMNVHPRELAASRARGAIADEGTSVVSTANARALAKTAEAHKALESQTVEGAPILDQFLKVVRGRRYAEDGSPLPIVDLTRFNKEIPRLATAKVIPADRAAGLEQSGARIVDIEEAQAMGFNVERPSYGLGGPDELGRRSVGALPGGAARVKVMLEPRSLTAPEVDQLAARADDLAGFKDSSEARDPAWRGISQAIKEARDEFVLGGEPGGYSRLKNEQALEQNILESRMANSGLPGTPKMFEQLTPSQQTALTANLRDYSSGNMGRLDKDTALRELTANSPEARAALDRIANVGAAKDVADAYVGTSPVHPSVAETGGFPRPRLSVSLNPSLRMRLDAPMERVSSGVSGGRLGARVGAGVTPANKKRRDRP